MWITTRIQRFEAKIYLLIWISTVLYTIFKFTISARLYFQSYHDYYEDFIKGWSFLNFLNRDIADLEWTTIKYFITTIFPMVIFYTALCEAGRNFGVKREFQQYFQITFPLLYITYSMGYRVTLLGLLQPAVLRISSVKHNKSLTWLLSLLCLVLIALYKKISLHQAFLKLMGMNHIEAYLTILMLCWMNLKCTSASLHGSPKPYVDYLSYCFYLPTLFTGPFIDYEDFKKLQYVRTFGSIRVPLKKLILNILRCLFWMLFIEFWLHFIYVNATSFQLELVKSLDLSSLCGYGYLMGQFFHIKYVVVYGLSTSVASFENVPVPALPRCIGRIHLYSDMWKYFDSGLYRFLQTCIYIPSQNFGLEKIGSSFLCFAFVFIWHGSEEYIFVWAVLNFIGIVLEHVANKWYKTSLNSSYLKNLDVSSLRRIKCLSAAPLLAMSALSNFYFFAGKDVGNIFLDKVLKESILKQLFIIFALYCCCQVSTDFRDINAHVP